MQFIYGALGVISVLLIFAVGVVIGWKACKADEARRSHRIEVELGERERLQLKQEQEAFNTMLGYNIEMAYGIGDDEFPEGDS